MHTHSFDVDFWLLMLAFWLVMVLLGVIGQGRRLDRLERRVAALEGVKHEG